ncbi:MAG: M48 family metallopeptidase [Clostridia bacterium]|jgi:predicted metal-dependent hydrolase|nr:M48 family metallopeptidase [Clostridia bacterium]
MEKDFALVNGEKIYFYLQRKNVKNMNLRVNIDKKVTLSIPRKMPLNKAREFVSTKFEWIKKQQDFYDKFRMQREELKFICGETIYLLGNKYKLMIINDSKNSMEIKESILELHIKQKYISNKKYIEKVYDELLKEYAMHILEDLVIKYQNVLSEYSIKIPKIEIRQMKARWGSCMPIKNKVVFNLSLIKTPIECIEYVVLHELSHFRYQNHSKNFYSFVSLFMPDWKIRKKILDEEFTGVI